MPLARRAVPFAFLSLLLLAAPFPACRTTTIPSRAPIPVPPGLTDADVENAVMLALGEPSPGDVAGAETKVRPAVEQTWYPESASPGTVVAGIQRKTHYLQATISYDATEVQTRISGSRNLAQSATRIHGTALAWMDQLDAAIRQGLGRIATRKARGGAASPEASSPSP